MIFERKILHVLGVIALFLCISSGSALAFSFGALDEKTGAPNEGTCSDNYCHVGNDVNAPDGSLTLEFPEVYLPNEVYTIVVNLAHPEQSRWGFEMTALDENGASAGSFKITDGKNTQLSVANSKQYIKQTSAGTTKGKRSGNQWTVEWTAPDADIGTITFYAAGNAANADSLPTGDYIYTTQAESKPSITTIEASPPPPKLPPWDVNADGTVDIRDLVLVANQFGQGGEVVSGDINGDGMVDIRDLVLVASHFGEKTAAVQ